jgi:hypothetical protein
MTLEHRCKSGDTSPSGAVAQCACGLEFKASTVRAAVKALAVHASEANAKDGVANAY